ncbi:MAG: threonine synthase [Hyphomicrobiaceae bacterium]
MKYVSTRGEAPRLGFEDVLLAGLARDGGLYVPAEWPRLTPEEIAAFAGARYEDVAFAVMRPFMGDAVPADELRAMIEAAYAGFAHRSIAPLVEIAPNDWVLELFHGPTLAFKDVAMQVLARLMDRTLDKRGERATIIGATSGDTGGAAIEAFRGREAIDVFILYPHGRVSDVQRRQMTTPSEANVHAIAVKGTFDDCQNLVKAMFGDLALRDRLGLTGVNSINWARLMAQIVYFFSAAASLGAPGRKMSFSVPTGNFGDVFAGYAACRMGLPVERLLIATNVNDILARTLASGRYEPRGVVATQSPSMDIQISSNFERLLFDLAGRDSARVRALMAELNAEGRFVLTPAEIEGMRALFDADRVDEAETVATIRALASRTGYVADPHTAVGIAAAARKRGDRRVPMVMLATAHPAKFPATVEAATGRAPPEPDIVARQRTASERTVVLENDVTAVSGYVERHARSVGRTA